MKVGLFAIGLAAYWPQFPGLRERLTGYARFVAGRIEELGASVVDAGLVDDHASAVAAGETFRAADVDLAVCFVTTYATSATVLPVVRDLGRPVLILNLQPTARLDYARTGTGEWLANCQACCVPEIACAFARCGLDFHTVSGLLGAPEQPDAALADEVTADHPAATRAWGEIGEWIDAVRVQRSLRGARIGFLGHTYPGMLDMYSDFTQVTGALGVHVEVLEMEDLEASVDAVTADESEAMEAELTRFFTVAEANPNDPLSLPPDVESFRRAATVAAGLAHMATRFDLSGLSYYHRGRAGGAYAELSAAMIPGLSLLTARGVPCAGEGDLKNALAMKIMDLLGAGGSFTELYAMDFTDEIILMGHDGPFHLAIAEGSPVLRQLRAYHGKVGAGLSVEARVKTGPVTILGLTQTGDGRLKMLVAEGWCLPGETLRIGNTNSRLRFTASPEDAFDVAAWMTRWASQGPTHHVALGVGHRASVLRRLESLLKLETVVLGPL